MLSLSFPSSLSLFPLLLSLSPSFFVLGNSCREGKAGKNKGHGQVIVMAFEDVDDNQHGNFFVFYLSPDRPACLSIDLSID
jgi:hypothetical protein